MLPTGVGRIVHASRVIARWLFGPIALVFLLGAGWKAWPVLMPVLVSADWTVLMAAVALWAPLHLVSPVPAWLLFRELGVDVPYRTLLGIHVGRLPTKYLPGGIWHTVSRMMDLRAHGATRAQLMLLVALENLLPPSVTLTLGGLCFVLGGKLDPLSVGAVVAGLLGLIITAFAPRHAWLRQQRRLSLLGYLKIVTVTFGFWIVAASAFYCFWRAFPATRDVVNGLFLCGSYLLAWCVGFVSILTPQGLGAFEFVAGFLLQGSLTLAGAAVLAGGFRVVVLAADALAFAILMSLRLVLASSLRKNQPGPTAP